MKTISACSVASWDSVCCHVNHAIVFMDNVSAELLHWHGGLQRLLNAGAQDVKELSSFESGGSDHKKGVFIISSLLEGVAREILRDIIQASQFQYVVVITSVSPSVHVFSRSGAFEDDQHFFGQVEDRLLEWMGNMNYTAEVIHIPLFTVSLGNYLFLTPGFSGLFPLTNADLHQVELLYRSRHAKDQRDFESLSSVDLVSLPHHQQIYYKKFISAVDSLLTDIGVKEDIYSMGYTSGMLATELESYPPARSRRKVLTDRASIVFIDRTLDLATPTSHNTESLLDKIMQVLPRLPGHQIDVAVDMSPLCHVDQTGSGVICPGSLAPQSPKSQTGIHSMVTGKQKEGLMEVNRHLVEAAATCNLPLSLKGKPTRITAEQLESTLQLFQGKYSEISAHLDAVQVAMATAQTLGSSKIPHLDELISVEKGLLQGLSDPDDTEALLKIAELVDKKDKDTGKYCFSLDDLLCVLVHAYSLGGPSVLDREDLEAKIQTVLVTRIMEEKESLSPIIKTIVGSGVSDVSIVSDIIEDTWERLLAVAGAREHLQHYRSVITPGSAVSPASQNPLCTQVLEAIFDPEKKDLVDIDFKSSGLRDMLKAGFGLFRSVTKPRPSDHPLLILFIVGGVTSTEVKHVRDTVSQFKPATQVIVGSTRLLSPGDVVQAVLCASTVTMEET